MFMKSHSRNFPHNMHVTNVYGFHDITSSNQIWSQLLWADLHPTPEIFSQSHMFSLALKFLKIDDKENM